VWLIFPYYLKYRAQIFQYFAFVSIILFLWFIFICYSHSTCGNIMKLFNFGGNIGYGSSVNKLSKVTKGLCTLL